MKAATTLGNEFFSEVEPEVCLYCKAMLEKEKMDMTPYVTPNCESTIDSKDNILAVRKRKYDQKKQDDTLLRFGCCPLCCKCPPCRARVEWAKSGGEIDHSICHDCHGEDYTTENGGSCYDEPTESGQYTATESTFHELVGAIGSDSGEGVNDTPVVGVERLEGRYTRYFVPEVCDWASGSPINCAWPAVTDGIFFRFSGKYNSVIRIEVDGMDSTFMCNCVAKPGREGEKLRKAMEGTLDYLHKKNAPGSNLDHLLANRLVGEGLLPSTRSLECVHVNCVKKLVECGAECVNNVVEPYGKGVFPLDNIDEGSFAARLHVNCSSTEVQFSSDVTVNNRGGLMCIRHEGSCHCKNLVNSTLQLTDGCDRNEVPEDIPPVSWKPRPLHWEQNRSNVDAPSLWQGGNCPWPDKCIPNDKCTCKSDSGIPCTCRLNCDCGCAWGTDSVFDCYMDVHSDRWAKRVELHYLKCTDAACGGTLPCDGLEHGITLMHRNTYKSEVTMVAICTVYLLRIVRSIQSNGTTLSDQVKSLNRSYTDAGAGQSQFVVNKQSFIDGVWKCLSYLILPYIMYENCPCCGPCPKNIIMDGTSLGILRRNIFRKYFSKYPKQEGAPVMEFPDEGKVRLLVRSHAWNELCVFSGDDHVIGELLVGFATGQTQKKKREKIRDFRRDEAEKLRQKLLENIEKEECKAAFFIVDSIVNADEQARAIPKEQPGLAGICQSYGCKSVAAICGAAGGGIVFSLLHLAGGGRGEARIPKCFLVLHSVEQLCKKAATALLTGDGSDNIDTVVDDKTAEDVDNFFGALRQTIADGTDERIVFSRAICLTTLNYLQRLLLRQINHDIVRNSFYDVADDGPTVTDFMGKIFPHLEIHLRTECDQVLRPMVRPMFAHLASKSWLLWSQEVSYVWAHLGSKLTTSNLKTRNISLDNIIEKAAAEKHAAEAAACATEEEQYTRLLREILECDEQVC